MQPAKHVLVVDDEKRIREVVEYALQKDGYRVSSAPDGLSALAAVDRDPPDLVVLDVMLPGLDGLSVCKKIRAQRQTPILFLSARADEVDRIVGLELGGDDYLVKPFSPRELVARVKAVLRRADGPAKRDGPAVLTVGAVEVDLGRAEARVEGAPVALTTREFALVQYLAENRGLALSRRQLLNGAWGADWYGDERTVDVHVRQLRKKLGDALPLATVRGIGYRLG
jgi:two-component system OmpR family response regulator